jgi:hypothetical protein
VNCFLKIYVPFKDNRERIDYLNYINHKFRKGETDFTSNVNLVTLGISDKETPDGKYESKIMDFTYTPIGNILILFKVRSRFDNEKIMFLSLSK